MAEALRFNSSKPMISSIHPMLLKYFQGSYDSIYAFGMVGAFGNKKYDAVAGTRCNYMLGGKNLIEYMDCAIRHVMRFEFGQELDPDSGLHHLFHAVWNIVVLSAFSDNMEQTNSKPIIVADHVKLNREFISRSSADCQLWEYMLQVSFIEGDKSEDYKFILSEIISIIKEKKLCDIP